MPTFANLSKVLDIDLTGRRPSSSAIRRETGSRNTGRSSSNSSSSYTSPSLTTNPGSDPRQSPRPSTISTDSARPRETESSTGYQEDGVKMRLAGRPLFSTSRSGTVSQASRPDASGPIQPASSPVVPFTGAGLIGALKGKEKDHDNASGGGWSESGHGESGANGGVEGPGQGVTSSEQAMVAILISRLSSKLPSVTGRSLDAVEADKLYTQLRDSLIDYSKERLSIVMHGVMGLLETFIKQTNSAPSANPPIYILKSQILVLRIVSACLLASWERSLSKRDPPEELMTVLPPSLPPPMEDALAKYVLGVMTLYVRFTTYLVGGNLSRNAGESIKSSSSGFSIQREREAVAHAGLQVAQANQGLLPGTYATKGCGNEKTPGLVDTMRDIVRLVESRRQGGESRTNIMPVLSGGPDIKTPASVIRRPSLQSLRSVASSSFTSGSKLHPKLEAPDGSSSQLMLEIATETARIIWLLSSYSWPTVWARLRAKLKILTEKTEEGMDALDMVMLQWCDLDQSRLGQVLEALTPVYPHLGPTSQPAVANVLYLSIRQWISSRPVEFVRLQEGRTKMSGKPDDLFDIVHAISQTAEGARYRSIVRPCKGLLLLLCPELLHRAWDGDDRNIRRTQYFDQVRQGVKSARVDEASLFVHVDMCRAAIMLPGNSHADLLVLEQDMNADVRDVIVHGISSNTNGSLVKAGIKYVWMRNPSLIIDLLGRNDAPTHFMVDVMAQAALELLSCVAFDLVSAQSFGETAMETQALAVRGGILDGLGHGLAGFCLRTSSLADSLPVLSLVRLYAEHPDLAGVNSIGVAGQRDLLAKLNALVYCDGTIGDLAERAVRSIQLSTLDGADPQAVSTLAAVVPGMLIEAVDRASNVTGQRNRKIAYHLCDQMDVLMRLTVSQGVWFLNLETFSCTLVLLLVQLVQLTSITQLTLQCLHRVAHALETIRPPNAFLVIVRFLHSLPHPGEEPDAIQAGLMKAWSNASAEWPLQVAWLVICDIQAELTASILAAPTTGEISRGGQGRIATHEEDFHQYLWTVTNVLASSSRAVSAPAWRAELESAQKRLVPPGMSMEHPSDAISSFILATVDWLVADSLTLRRHAKEALACLPDTALAQLLDHIVTMFEEAEHDEEAAGTWSLLANGLIAILHSILKLPTFPALITCSNFRLALQLLMSRLDTIRDSSVAKTSRLKACLLIQSAAGHEAQPPDLACLIGILDRWLWSSSAAEDNDLRTAIAKALTAVAASRGFATCATAAHYADMFGLPLSRKQFLHHHMRLTTMRMRHDIWAREHLQGYVRSLGALDCSVASRLLGADGQDVDEAIMLIEAVTDGIRQSSQPRDVFRQGRTPPLLEFLFDNEACLVALAQSANADHFASCLTGLYGTYHQAGELPLITSLVRNEVAQVSRNDLLRSNSVTTKTLVLLLNRYEGQTLRRIITPLVRDLQRGLGSIRLDALDVGQSTYLAETKAEAIEFLSKVIRGVLGRFSKQVGIMSNAVRTALLSISSVVEETWPLQGGIAISGIVILRWLLPSMLSPERLDLDIDIETRKALLLISKMINAAATGSFLREGHLIALNEQILDISGAMQGILSTLGAGSAPSARVKPRPRPESTQIRGDLVCLYDLMRQPSLRERMHLNSHGDLYKSMELLLAGPSTIPSLFSDVHRRMTDDVAFHEGDPARDGSRVFYLNLAELDLASTTIISHIYTAMRSVGEGFHVVVDMVGGSTAFTDYAPLLAQLYAIPHAIRAKAKVMIQSPSFDGVADLIRQSDCLFATRPLCAAPTWTGTAGGAPGPRTYRDRPLGLAPMSPGAGIAVRFKGIPVLCDVSGGDVRISSQYKEDLTSDGATCELYQVYNLERLPSNFLALFEVEDLPRVLKMILISKSFHMHGVCLATVQTYTELPFLASSLFHLLGPERARLSARSALISFKLRCLDTAASNSEGSLGLGKGPTQLYAERAVANSKELAVCGQIPRIEMAIALVALAGSAGWARWESTFAIILPWIAAIVAQYRGGTLTQSKTRLIRELVDALVDLRQSSNNGISAGQAIWGELGRSGEGLLEVVLQELVNLALQRASGVASALGALDHPSILPRIIHRWRRLITQTSPGPVDDQEGLLERTQVQCLTEFIRNMLESSTSSLNPVVIPDLIFGIVMLMRKDDLRAKHRIYRIWLAVKGAVEKLDHTGRPKSMTLDDAADMKLVFDIGSHLGICGTSVRDDVQAMEKACSGLFAAMERTTYSNQLTARLATFTAVSAFQRGPAQSRSVILLRLLVQRDASRVIVGDLLFQIAFVVADTMARGRSLTEELDLVQQLIRTLEAMVGTAAFGPSAAFALGLTLLQTSCADLAACGLGMLSRALERVMEQQSRHKGQSLEMLLTSQELANLALEEESGLAMDGSTSSAFVLATLISRCLAVPDVEAQATQVLTVLLQLGTGLRGDTLMPLRLIGIRGGDDEIPDMAAFLEIFASRSTEMCIMGVAMMVARLKAVDSIRGKTQTLHLVMALRSTAKPALIAWLPDIIRIVLSQLRTTDDVGFIRVAMDIMELDASLRKDGQRSSPNGRELLEQWGLDGLLMATFGSQSEDRIVPLMRLAAKSFLSIVC